MATPKPHKPMPRRKSKRATSSGTRKDKLADTGAINCKTLFSPRQNHQQVSLEKMARKLERLRQAVSRNKNCTNRIRRFFSSHFASKAPLLPRGSFHRAFPLSWLFNSRPLLSCSPLLEALKQKVSLALMRRVLQLAG